MTKEELEEYLERLKIHILFLNEKIAILRFLREERWNDDRYKKITHLSRPFFYFVEQALQTDIIVTLDKIYDERGERSLVKYLNQIQMHLSSVFNRDEIKDQISEIKKADVLLKKIEINRDKFYAHFDKQYFDNPEQIMKDAPLSLEELSELVELAKKIIRRHYLVFHDAGYIFLELHDAQSIFNAASGYMEYLHELERNLRK